MKTKNKNLVKYAICFVPKGNRRKNKKACIVKKPTYDFAKDEQEVLMKAAQNIDEQYNEMLEDIQIYIRWVTLYGEKNYFNTRDDETYKTPTGMNLFDDNTVNKVDEIAPSITTNKVQFGDISFDVNSSDSSKAKYMNASDALSSYNN